MKKRVCFLIVSGIVAGLAIGNLPGRQPGDTAPKAQAVKGKDQPKENVNDTAAIKKSGESFLKAYLAGDAKGMAAHWTENGEYFTDDGTILRGRAEIEKVYSELFAKKKGTNQREAEIEDYGSGFPSKDTAIEEGFFKSRVGKEAADLRASIRCCMSAKAANGSWRWCVNGPMKGAPCTIWTG